jgi:uncharacterized coiled-coil protein SlyX
MDLQSEVDALQEMLDMQDQHIAALKVAINELQLLCDKKYEKLEEMNPELEGGYRSSRKHRTKKYRNKKRGTKRR